jgi:hypothetical protein
MIIKETFIITLSLKGGASTVLAVWGESKNAIMAMNEFIKAYSAFSHCEGQTETFAGFRDKTIIFVDINREYYFN